MVLHAPLNALGAPALQGLEQGMGPAEGVQAQVDESHVAATLPPLMPANLQGNVSVGDRIQSNTLTLDGTNSLQPSITDSIMPAVPAAQVVGSFSQISPSSTSYSSHPTIPTAIGMDALRPESNEEVVPTMADQVVEGLGSQTVPLRDALESQAVPVRDGMKNDYLTQQPRMGIHSVDLTPHLYTTGNRDLSEDDVDIDDTDPGTKRQRTQPPHRRR